MTITTNGFDPLQEDLPERAAQGPRDALRQFNFERATQAVRAHWSENCDHESTPPVVDGLRLNDYLGDQLAHMKDKLRDIKSYVWYAEGNYEDAEAYCFAAIAASKSGDEEAMDFFVKAVDGVRNFDRAVRAHAVHKTAALLLRDEIPKTITVKKSVGGYKQKVEYQLKVTKFKWSTSIPSDAVRKAAQMQIDNPPDAFWIAEYKEQATTYDPILYASYGEWQVEVGHWE